MIVLLIWLMTDPGQWSCSTWSQCCLQQIPTEPTEEQELLGTGEGVSCGGKEGGGRREGGREWEKNREGQRGEERFLERVCTIEEWMVELEWGYPCITYILLKANWVFLFGGFCWSIREHLWKCLFALLSHSVVECVNNYVYMYILWDLPVHIT